MASVHDLTDGWLELESDPGGLIRLEPLRAALPPAPQNLLIICW